MKANEFVKKFGCCEAKRLVDHALRYDEPCLICSGSVDFDLKDLKRLVESYELVEKYKVYGYSAKWFFVANYCEKNKLSPFDSDNFGEASSIYEQAITDVESCL